MCAEGSCKSLRCNRSIGHELRLLVSKQAWPASFGSNNANAGRISAECGAQSSTKQGINATGSAKSACRLDDKKDSHSLQHARMPHGVHPRVTNGTRTGVLHLPHNKALCTAIMAL